MWYRAGVKNDQMKPVARPGENHSESLEEEEEEHEEEDSYDG